MERLKVFHKNQACEWQKSVLVISETNLHKKSVTYNVTLAKTLMVSWIYNTCQKSLGNFQKLWKHIVFSAFQSLHLLRTPFPPKQSWSVPETLGFFVHEKLFCYHMHFSQKPTLFMGRRGTNVPSRTKICKVSKDFWRVLYLLPRINRINSRVYFLMKFLGALCWVNSEPSSNSRRHGNTGEIKELKKEASPQTEPDEQQLNTFWSILFNKKLSI